MTLRRGRTATSSCSSSTRRPGKAYAGTKDGLDAARPGRRHDRERHDHRGRRLRDGEGPGPAHDRRGDGQAPRPDRRHVVRPGGGAQPGGRAAADAEVRRVAGRLRQPRDTKAVYADNGEGSYVSASGEALEPGWRTHVGLKNFKTIFTDPLVRDPFVRVFIWTFVYAGLSVFLTFALGLFLAITLNKPEIRLQRLQRALLVIPFAIPAYLSVLVWGGLLNDDFGGDQQPARDPHPVALRPDLGQGLVRPRQPLARLPLLLPRLHRGAAGDPGRSSPRRRASTARRRARCSGR